MTRLLSSLLAIALVVTCFPGSAPAAADEDPLRMGCVSFAKQDTAQAFRQVTDYASKQIGRQIVLTLYPNYQEVIHDLVNDNIELAVLSPLVYITASKACRLHTVAEGIYRATGNFTYKSIILVPKASKVRKLQDLSGRTMAFVDLLSVSGYVIPKDALVRAGVKGRKNVKASFYGNHVDAVRAVLDGKAEAAATYDLVFKGASGLSRERRRLRRLWASDFAIPSDAFVTTSKVPIMLRKELRSALLSYFADQARGQTPKNDLYEGFVPGDPNIYADLRNFIHSVNAR